MESFAKSLPVPVLRPAALSAGISDTEIRRLRRNGTWTSIRRGSYLPPGELEPLDDRQKHELLLRSTLAGLRTPAVVSHSSAAVLWGLPLWATPLDFVHITRPSPAHGGRSGSLHCHAAALAAAEVMVVRGFSVTSPARTVADLARLLPFEQAVVAADGALRSGLLTVEQLHAAGVAMAGAPGSRNAHKVARFADRLSESVGESRSRVLMHQGGVPRPTLQFEVSDQAGRPLGRSDFSWLDGLVLGEFDGRIKYGRLLKTGETAGDAVYREKLREDAFRDTGARVVRWNWAELSTPWLVMERIQRALASVEKSV